jgi:endonuclease YncB( thermonuclease family)
MTENGHFQLPFSAPGQWIRTQAAIKFVAPVSLALLVLACLQAPAAARSTRSTQSGVVTHVVDGDTVWVKTSASQQPLKVRIQGIDAPEICQPGGIEAQAALKSRVLGQSVTVTSGAHDDYGRTIGTLYWQGQDVGRWMVASGHAWVYSFRNKKGPYADELAQAQTGRRGLFSDAAAEEPRLFRTRHGSCYTNRSSSYKKTSSF